jgi:hypothetical protein
MDRRRSFRLPTDLLIRSAEGEGAEALSVAADLSEDGLFVEYVLPYRPGDLLNLTFGLPGGGEVMAQARVVSAQRFVPSDASGKVGNGLEFVGLDEAAKERIRGWVGQQMA